MAERTNQAWLDDLKGNNRDAALFDLRQRLIKGLTFALSSRIDRSDKSAMIEDFVQDALLKILDNLHTFRGESRFTTWAQKIAVRVAYTELRRRRWHDISIEDLMPENNTDFVPLSLSDPSPNPEKQNAQQMVASVVQRLINEELTERQRTVMLSAIVGQMPLDEVARRMGTNRNALYKLIHDARRKLFNSLQKEGFTPADLLAAFE